MTGNIPTFKLTRKGYDQAQVAAYVGDLVGELGSARDKVAQLTGLVEQLQAERGADGEKAATRYGGFGERLDQILAMAEVAAAELRAEAIAEADQLKAEVENWAESLLEAAKGQAAKIREDAGRDALATRSEAQAYWEAQRASATQLTADLEKVIAARREQAEREAAQSLAAAGRQVAASNERAAQVRAEAEELRARTEATCNALVANAQRRAQEIITSATADADRARDFSEREARAAAERRDSIVAQLGNLRHLLNTAAPEELARSEAGPEVGLQRPERDGGLTGPAGPQQAGFDLREPEVPGDEGPITITLEAAEQTDDDRRPTALTPVRNLAALRHVGGPGLSITREDVPQKREPA